MEIIIKVNSTYNNTIVSALYRGKILKTISTGSLGFKKAKRASTLAAQTCGEALGSWLLQLNKHITLVQKARKPGLDTSREGNSKIASLPSKTSAITVTSLKDNSIEYSVLQEAKKKIAGAKFSTNSKKSNVTNRKLTDYQKDASDSDVNTGLLSNNKGLDVKQQNTEFMIKQVSLLIAGVGYGKFGVIRGLSKLGIKIKTISDVTVIPHNGCKPPKMRRK